MKKNRVFYLQIVAILLVVLMLAGCTSPESDAGSEYSMVVPGETISSDSKWINSSIQGAINAETPVNLKDDFHTAINRDWLLETNVTEDDPSKNLFSDNETVLTNRKLAIITNSRMGLIGAENSVGLRPEQLANNQSLVSNFYDLVGNWEERNRQGVEPARMYLQAIESIENMDQMTAYLLNQEKNNFVQEDLVPIHVEAPLNDRDINTVKLATDVTLSLSNQDQYNAISLPGVIHKNYNEIKVKYLLERLGYSAGDIRAILTKCYQFETKLAGAMKSQDDQNNMKYLEKADNTYSLEQIKAIEGNYPLTEILINDQLNNSERFTVLEPDYVKKVGKFYDQKNLEEIKSYYLVRTAEKILPLLDREAFDKHVEITDLIKGKADKTGEPVPKPEDDDTGKTPEELESKILLDNFMAAYLAEPMDQIYVAQYCKPEEKEAIKNLIARITDYYRVMLQGETWLSQDVRNTAVKKLDNMSIKVLYPDTFVDYTGLNLSSATTAANAVSEINSFKRGLLKNRVNAPVNRNYWDMAEMPTTEANAFYRPGENSINIIAGIIADGNFYSSGMAEEDTLARLGSVIGHEITHAFDDNGLQYDEEGRYLGADLSTMFGSMESFPFKVAEVQHYYEGIIPYPGATKYEAQITGEAIADMGSVKCMLAIAEENPAFDYSRFFASHSQMWRSKTTYKVQKVLAKEDVHPLAFLRTNVTLQQFDKFYETFDIQPGDGMYIEPDKRILIW